MEAILMHLRYSFCFACALLTLHAAATRVLAQTPAPRTATASDLFQLLSQPGDIEIVLRDGKAFLRVPAPPPAPAEELRLDTSEMSLPLKVFSPQETIAPRCYAIVNQGKGTVRLSIAPLPGGAREIFAAGIPDALPPGANVRICPSNSRNAKVANVIVSAEVQRNGSTEFEPADVVSFSSAAPTPDLVIDMKGGGTTAQGVRNPYEAVVRLDGTGIADWRFLNPQRIHRVCVFADSSTTCAARGAGSAVELLFVNTLSDRVLVVTFTDIPPDQRGRFLQAGLNLACSGGKCTASIQVERNGRARIPVAILQGAYAQGGTSPPVQFTVSKFVEDTPLANSLGYFTVVPLMQTAELPAKSGWSFVGQSDAAYEPDLTGLFAPCAPAEDCSKDPSITTVRTLGGMHRTRVNGTARLGFVQSLGARADVDVEVQIKKGELGGDPSTAQVKPTKYRLNVNARNGWVISGGRYTFAEPGQSISISESGEGLSVRYRFFEMGHLFKREAGGARVQRLIHDATDEDPTNDRKLEDGDHSTTMVQVRELTTPGGHLRLNAIVLYGRSEPQGIRSKYATGGGDVTYWIPVLNSVNTLSWYHSRRDSASLLKDGTDRGSGTAWLLTSNWTNLDRSQAAFEKQPTDFTVALSIGRGSGDRSATATRGEDYIGETAGFTPDLIFLNTLADAFGIDPVSEGRIGKGLSNKLYIGLSVDTPRFSPLVYLAGLFRTRGDVAKDGSGMSGRWHWYRLNEAVLGSHRAGHEFDLDFRIESPAKVKYSVAMGVYVPGAAVKPLVTKTQWKIGGNISVKM